MDDVSMGRGFARGLIDKLDVCEGQSIDSFHSEPAGWDMDRRAAVERFQARRMPSWLRLLSDKRIR